MPATSTLPTCTCGHDRNHPLAQRKSEYTFWGKIGLYTGISVNPIHIRYQCSKCGNVFDETTDPAELNKYLM